MEEKKLICSECGEPIADGKYYTTNAGDVICKACFEFAGYAKCDSCGGIFHEDDLKYFGDDYRLCPSCFAEEFPPFDEQKNEEDTTVAYEAMLQRMIGRRIDDDEQQGEIEIETDMDEDGYRNYLTVTVDEDGCIEDVSRLKRERCRVSGLKYEDWLPIPVDDADYEEDGLVEEMIDEYLGLSPQ